MYILCVIANIILTIDMHYLNREKYCRFYKVGSKMQKKLKICKPIKKL